MGRRFQEIEEAEARAIGVVKDGILGLNPVARAHILAWLCTHFDDAGERVGIEGPKRGRIGGFWLVRIPRRRAAAAPKPDGWSLPEARRSGLVIPASGRSSLS
jgi:hypothetical protein